MPLWDKALFTGYEDKSFAWARSREARSKSPYFPLKAAAVAVLAVCVNSAARLSLQPDAHFPGWWQWAGIVALSFVSLAGLFWLAQRAPNYRRIRITQRSVQVGKRLVKFEKIRGMNGRNEGGHSVVTLLLLDESFLKFGVGPEERSRIEEILRGRGIPEIATTEAEKEEKWRRGNLPLIVYLSWAMILPLCGLAMGLLLPKIKSSHRSESSAVEASLLLRQELRKRGVAPKHSRELSDEVGGLIHPQPWSWLGAAKDGALFGVLAAWGASGFAAMGWAKRRELSRRLKMEKGSFSDFGPDSLDEASERKAWIFRRIGLGMAVIIFATILALVISEQTWETSATQHHATEIDRLRARLSKLEIASVTREEFINRTIAPPPIFMTRILLGMNAAAWPVALGLALVALEIENRSRRTQQQIECFVARRLEIRT